MQIRWLKTLMIGIAIVSLLGGVLPFAAAQREPAALSGTVTGGAGEPLDGVTVTLASAANFVDTIVAPYAADAVERIDTVTDGSGNYSFTDVPPGDYVIFATGADLADLRALTVVLQAGDTQTQDFSMTPGGSIIGAISSASGLPIFGGSITLFDRGLAVQSVFARSDGTYLFEHVVPGSNYQLFAQTATEAALTSTDLAVNEGEALELDLDVAPASRLSGQVLSDTGEPIAGAVVSVESPALRWAGLTDASGIYDLSGAGIEYGSIIPDVYDVRIRADRHSPIFEQSIDLRQPGEYIEDFTLARAGAVAGVVLGSDGLPVADATVSAVGESGSEYATLTLDDGSYTLDLLDTSLTYTLIASANNYAPVTLGDIVVNQGEVLDGTDFTLPLGSYLEGVVTRANNGSEPNALIDIYDVEGNLQTTLSGADGNFAFGGFAPGDYTLSVSTAFQDVGFVGGITLDGTPLELQISLEETGVLRGTATGASAVVVSFEGVVLTVQAVDASGVYEVVGLAPGAYEAMAIGETGQSEPTPIEIVAGGENTVDLPIQ